MEKPAPPGHSNIPKLLQLPRELRDRIYSYVFAQTRLAFGKRHVSRRQTITIKPIPRVIAILGTCRQINEEARDVCLGEVLLVFESLESVLDKLSVLPSTTLSKIRHVRTNGQPLMLSPPRTSGRIPYRVASVFQLLPSLQLHTLTILGSPSGPAAYDTLHELIQHGGGWRLLQFIAPNSTMLCFKKFGLLDREHRRAPQPSTWNDVLQQRDGVRSGPSVTLYRSTQRRSPGSVFNPRSREVFEQTVSTPQELETYGLEVDAELLPAAERDKEFLFIVRRGRSADISVAIAQDEPPSSKDDLRQWANGMTWAEIKRKYTAPPVYESEDEDDYFAKHFSDGEEIVVDTYNSVDEYVWPNYRSIRPYLW